jgi:ribonuclease BN (tRNA processing enzyme)
MKTFGLDGGIAVHVLYSIAGVATTVAVENRGGFVLLDCGDGALRDLLDARLKPVRLEGVAFSHGHFDHVGGLHTLLGFLRMVGREAALPVVYPAGCVEVEAFLDRFYELYPDAPFAVERLPLTDGDETKLDRWSLSAYAVEHRGSTAAGVGESIPALGYRVGLGEVVVAFSGDTGPGENLRKLCEGVDLALIEATWGDREQRLNPRVHLSRAEAEGYGRLAKRFGLIHGMHPSEGGD